MWIETLRWAKIRPRVSCVMSNHPSLSELIFKPTKHRARENRRRHYRCITSDSKYIKMLKEVKCRVYIIGIYAGLSQYSAENKVVSFCVPVALPRIAMQKKLRGFQDLRAHTNKKNDFASSGNQNPAVQPVIR